MEEANYERHALSAAFPDLRSDELASLARDIEANGLREPIVLFQGQIIDGWNRYCALLQTSQDPRFVELPADVDPVAYVLSQNLHRRHLTDSQRAAAVTACHEWKSVGNPEFSNYANLRNSTTAAELADMAHVSRRTVVTAKQVIREAPELVPRVISGELSVSRAAKMARGEPEPELKPRAKPALSVVETDWQAKHDLLQAQYHELAEELRNMTRIADELQKENDAYQKIIDADPQLAEAWAENKKLRETLRIRDEQIYGLQNTANAAIRAAKSARKAAEKLK